MLDARMNPPVHEDRLDELLGGLLEVIRREAIRWRSSETAGGLEGFLEARGDLDRAFFLDWWFCEVFDVAMTVLLFRRVLRRTPVSSERGRSRLREKNKKVRRGQERRKPRWDDVAKLRSFQRAETVAR